jgi:hypothetical protein
MPSASRAVREVWKFPARGALTSRLGEELREAAAGLRPSLAAQVEAHVENGLALHAAFELIRVIP